MRSPSRLVGLAAGLMTTALALPALVQAEAPPGTTFGDDAQVTREIEEILSGPDFRRLRAKPPQSEWLEELLKWLADLFRPRETNASGFGWLLQALAYGIVAAICGLVIWLVVRAVNNYRAKTTIGTGKRRAVEEGDAEVPPGDLPADEYLRRATELAAKGLYREAIGQLLLGAMSHTERNGLIRFRRGLTHRDYLRVLRGRTRPHQAFGTMVSVYEPICFGRRLAEIDHYRTSLDGYQAGFHEPLSMAAASAKAAP